MRAPVAIVIAAAVLMTISILLFFQYKDPMILVLGIVLSGMSAGIVAFLRLMRRGIPVRVVKDEKGDR